MRSLWTTIEQQIKTLAALNVDIKEARTTLPRIEANDVGRDAAGDLRGAVHGAAGSRAEQSTLDRGRAAHVASIPRQQVVDPVHGGNADVRRIRRGFTRKRSEFQQPPSQHCSILRRIETRHNLQRRQASAGGIRVACRGFYEYKLRSDENKPPRRIAPPFVRHGLLCRNDEVPRRPRCG